MMVFKGLKLAFKDGNSCIFFTDWKGLYCFGFQQMTES